MSDPYLYSYFPDRPRSSTQQSLFSVCPLVITLYWNILWEMSDRGVLSGETTRQNPRLLSLFTRMVKLIKWLRLWRRVNQDTRKNPEIHMFDMCRLFRVFFDDISKLTFKTHWNGRNIFFDKRTFKVFLTYNYYIMIIVTQTRIRCTILYTVDL